ncbi:TonB-dependent receptor [Aquirhabdus sp.]|uniref:TonB-dependent receptor n=1 Tax=Aquirhabdus sp. TaxID=2824160 RepID=UPI00396C468C
MQFQQKPLARLIFQVLFGGVSLVGVAHGAETESVSTAAQTTGTAQSAAVTQADSAKSDDSNADAKPNQLNSVVVTANRRKERVQKVPSAVSVISGKDLIDSGVGKTAGEIIQSIPNASAATSGGHTRPRWWIRGVGTGTQGLDSPSPVAIYQDDVYLNNAAATGFPLFDQDRVEVLRGPQGTLWGKNTTGGAVNFLSKRPSFDNSGYAKLDYGSFNDKTIQAAYGGSVIDDTLASRVSFYRESRDGTDRNGYSGQKEGGFTDTAGRFQFLAHVTDNTEALLNLHFRDYTINGTTATVIGTGKNGAYWSTGIPAPYIPSTGSDDVNANVDATNTIHQEGASLNIKSQFERLELTSITAFEKYSNESITDGDNTPVELSRGHTDASTHQFTQEFRLASPKSDQLSWVLGTHYFSEGIDSDTAAATLPVAAKPSNRATAYNDVVFNQVTDSYAVFGSTTFKFNEQFWLTGGLRWSTEKKSIDLNRWTNPAAVPAQFSNQPDWWLLSSVSSPLVINATQDATNRWSDWTYDLTPEYHFSDTARVYAKVATGFRGGGYNSAPTSQAGVNVLSPEHLLSYELGFKSELLDGRVNLNANVFTYDYKDMQINAVIPSPTGALSQLRNAARGKAKGAELEVEALPIQNWHLKANLGWLDTRFKDFKDASGDYSGNKFVRSPEWTSSLSSEYDIPLGNGSKIKLAGDARYQSKFYFYANNQTDPNLAQNAYVLGNARISFIPANNKFTLTAYVNNITDKQYKQHTLPGTSGATGSTVWWGDPRTFGVSATTKF